MDTLLTAFLMALAMIVGVCLILGLCVFAAAGLANLINPSREMSTEEQARRTIAQRAEEQATAERFEKRAAARGRIEIDSHHVSFPTFGIVCASFLVFVSMSSILAHSDDPGEGFPLQLLLRPLWLAFALAFMAGTTAGSYYRRWFSRLPISEQRELKRRREAKEERSFRKRLKSIRESGPFRTG